MKAQKILDGSVTEVFGLGYCSGGVPREAREIWLLRFQGASPTPEPRFEAARDRLKRQVDEDPEEAGRLSLLGMFDAALVGSKKLLKKRSVPSTWFQYPEMRRKAPDS